MCNFHDFQNKYHDSLFEFDVNIIEKIISNDQLKLYNEEELFDIVLELYLKSKEYSTLFSHVNFLNLSTKSLLEFCQKFDINDIIISIWKNICFRLEQDHIIRKHKTKNLIYIYIYIYIYKETFKN